MNNFQGIKGMCGNCKDSLAYAKKRTKELLGEVNHAIKSGFPESEVVTLKRDMWSWEAFIADFGDK